MREWTQLCRSHALHRLTTHANTLQTAAHRGRAPAKPSTPPTRPLTPQLPQGHPAKSRAHTLPATARRGRPPGGGCGASKPARPQRVASPGTGGRSRMGRRRTWRVRWAWQAWPHLTGLVARPCRPQSPPSILPQPTPHSTHPTHPGHDIVPLVQGEAVIDALGQHNQVARTSVHAHPPVLLVPHVKVALRMRYAGGREREQCGTSPPPPASPLYGLAGHDAASQRGSAPLRGAKPGPQRQSWLGRPSHQPPAPLVPPRTHPRRPGRSGSLRRCERVPQKRL